MLPNLIYKSTISIVPFRNVDNVLMFVLCVPKRTTLHFIGEQLPPIHTTCVNVGAGIFLLDSMYLATEIVLEKTAANHSVSAPFPATGISLGGRYVIQAQPEQFSGIFQLEIKKIRPFCLL